MSRIVRFIKGRQGQWKRMQHVCQDREEKTPLLWIHCASLGEFEQGRPVMAAFRKQHPEIQILLTFFSPSGYEIGKTRPGRPGVLPAFGFAANARRFWNW